MSTFGENRLHYEKSIIIVFIISEIQVQCAQFLLEFIFNTISSYVHSNLSDHYRKSMDRDLCTTLNVTVGGLFVYEV